MKATEPSCGFYVVKEEDEGENGRNYGPEESSLAAQEAISRNGDWSGFAI
jgi:hypothetical protein